MPISRRVASPSSVVACPATIGVVYIRVVAAVFVADCASPTSGDLIALGLKTRLNGNPLPPHNAPRTCSSRVSISEAIVRADPRLAWVRSVVARQHVTVIRVHFLASSKLRFKT